MSNPPLRILDAFLERYPWPDRYLAMGQPLDFFWTFDVAAPLANVWPHLADTSRMNRALGYDRMDFDERDGVLHGSTHHGGVLHEWIEIPWDWISEREMVAAREYSRGFAKVVRSIFLLAPNGDGRTAVSVYFGWIPGNSWWKRWVLKFGFASAGADFDRFLKTVAAEAGEAPVKRLSSTDLPGDELTPSGAGVLAKGAAQLKGEGHDPALVDPLARWLETADPMELDRIHVRRLARQWDVDERQLLRVCLHATRAGLLQLSWDVVCPFCRGVRDELERLSELTATSSCAVCDEAFATAHPNVIEISFRVAAAVRAVPRLLYCSAEPAFKRHIVLQQQLPPGAERACSTGLKAGEYRVRQRGAGLGPRLVVSEEGPDALAIVASDLPAVDSEGFEVGPDAVLTLRNPTDTTTTVVVERPTWADDVLRPDDILTFPDFRDLFSGEFLNDELQLSVGVQTILFTDMVGSTRFYANRGDAAAYVEVNRHFKAIFEIVRRYEGAVVKTIGDAVMAVFARPADAVKASGDIHRAFGADHAAGIRLRISVHAGPVIAAPYNDGLDFFGRTVNLAAKLQACVGAGQVALSPEMMANPTVAAELEGETLVGQELDLQATGQMIAVTRWDVNP